MPDASTIHIFGIRHHGPGSARSLRQALDELQPDVVLVEGPPDAAHVLPLLTDAEMQPPVALLIYAAEDPRRAVYYPFAVFSPEWQAIHYSLTNDIPVRFMDLPQTHQLAIREAPKPPEAEETPTAEPQPSEPREAVPEEPASTSADEDETQSALADAADELPSPRADPLGWLARAAGYADGERWWEHMVEHRRDGTDLFAAILEAMTALRESVEKEGGAPLPQHNRGDFSEATIEMQREAWMRQTIRAAQSEGFQRIAVVCGAWHGPALAQMPPARDDTNVLKKMPKVKVEATWIPWTYSRLSYQSGYGAGIESPGWYDYLWNTNDSVAIGWMTRVARLLREQDLDASAAHVIEAVRLTEALSAIRDRPLPGLPELNEAARSVFCFGSDLPLQLIHEKLIIGEQLGQVPAATPMVPLQQDLIRTQKRLRLVPEASWRDLDLDLRKKNDLERSYLLHRLRLLEVPWGEQTRGSRGKGTFHEYWRIQWQPELAVALIEAGIWGNTIADAATAYTRDAAKNARDLPDLTKLVDHALLADLPDAVTYLMERLQAEAAIASDITHLMGALPPLANVLRYGNVRKTDASAVGQVVDGLVTRIFIGLPGACSSLNDDAAKDMFNRLIDVNSALALLQNNEHIEEWQRVLLHIADNDRIHGLVAGRCCRILLDAHGLASDEVAKRVSLALSTASAPTQAAAWVEGLLTGSGLLLLHDHTLWQILDTWVDELSTDHFIQILPLIRRTFSSFSAPERRQMGERARTYKTESSTSAFVIEDTAFDVERANTVIPLVMQLLGHAQENGHDQNGSKTD
ncbi:MAG: hypothetical protein GFH27_549331n15 [Chloroflexi bacterium AL-W]|nr:hypothetical protein [Chloroflexi bacterium AL-N1]NOK70316.1 hypothetical protein [Chloroflexi bacterium AL-N10]NOK77994.1 hypothetical protein [Chloroflexi bacterium AL-N5]NOK85093.1 hypothetical protein [Chloroflexi bacterium AL-W]